MSEAPNAFGIIQVFERLEVGPVKVERRRLLAPYRFVRDGEEHVVDFIYRFEENVFEPGDIQSQNLACIMAAQIAINYGLFCKTIVFHGPFDEIDRRFIEDMAENTAREIYVKKFLQPNPFLLGAAAHLPVVQLSHYLQAQLLFPDLLPAGNEVLLPWSATEPKEHAILSSGGKESLLSFGLITEVGFAAHPIFVNESGRHWFTAINSYKYFKESIPNTSRVWTNSDRVFVFALRLMPFISQDFATKRADDYPIRLWTVAIFLFAVLPLVRKRHLGRIVIGDEFDTTRQYWHEGIPHYDGLFDQSRYFDEVLSRYYTAKRWSVCQFSIVRPLSELLILNTLYNRYPQLQQHQVSCHAAHKEGERIHPCGKCEKCRRIVNMLMALGGDPTHCGYSVTQIQSCLERMTGKGSHQENADTQQLTTMLVKQGLITLNEERQANLKERPEIMNLRFCANRAPVDGIPLELRKPIYQILLAYADGAVYDNEGFWEPFDPLESPLILRPYTFENQG